MRTYLWRALVKSVCWMILVGGSFLAVHDYTTHLERVQDGLSYPEQIAARHDCWRSDAPEGVEPGHVVVRYHGEMVAHYRGAKATADALAYLFTDADHGVAEVYAFCR